MPPTIAVVEDEAPIQLMYKMKLEREGFRVATASNGREGLEVAKELHPALMLLDLRMPSMSGDAMLERMRATEWGKDIRVVILTNISKDEAPAVLRLLNVDRYVVKAHCTPTQVVEIVREVLDMPGSSHSVSLA